MQLNFNIKNIFSGIDGLDNISKYVKYAILLNAEVVSLSAQKIQEISEEFVKKNTDSDYEDSLSNIIDGVEKTLKDFSPQLEKVTDSVNKIKDNILLFPKAK